MFRAAVIACFAVASPAFAHAIRMKVDVTATEVRAEVRYDGADEDGGEVTVTLQRVNPKEDLGTSKLGKDGSCTFSRPASGRYRAVGQDDFGHRVVVEFDVTAGTETTAGSKGADTGGWLTLAGLGVIAMLALAGWWYAGRKKTHAA